MGTNFIPAREAQLVTYGLNFKTRIAATPTTFGLTAAQATAFGTLYDAFVSAYNITQSDATRTPASIITKDQAKADMIANLRLLAGIVQRFPGTTNTMRSELGLSVRRAPTPIPAPDKSPVVEVKSVTQNRVLVTLHAPNTTLRGKPAGVAGMAVFSYVGDAPPANIDAWKFEGNTTRTQVVVEFPTSAEPFSRVWLTAFYYNEKGQSGIATTPVSTNLGTWLVQSGTGELKLAA